MAKPKLESIHRFPVDKAAFVFFKRDPGTGIGSWPPVGFAINALQAEVLAVMLGLAEKPCSKLRLMLDQRLHWPYAVPKSITNDEEAKAQIPKPAIQTN